MEKNNALVRKLTEKLKVAKQNAEFVVHKNVKRFKGFDTRYMSYEEYFQIVQLHWFVQEVQNLTEEEMKNLLKARFFKFAFLRDVNEVVPNLIEELRNHTPSTIASMYVKLKYNQELMEKIENTQGEF